MRVAECRAPADLRIARHQRAGANRMFRKDFGFLARASPDTQVRSLDRWMRAAIE
jgi:hypothetical protein